MDGCNHPSFVRYNADAGLTVVRVIVLFDNFCSLWYTMFAHCAERGSGPPRLGFHLPFSYSLRGVCGKHAENSSFVGAVFLFR